MKKNEQILFLCQFFYPEKVSSAVLPFELAQAFVEHGYKVKSLNGFPKEYTDQKVLKKKELVNGVSINRVRYLQMKRSGFLGRIINYFSFCIAIFFHFLQFRNIDYCITYSNPPLLPFIPALFSSLFHFKIIYVVYDLYPDVAVKFNAIRKDSMIEKIMNFVNSFVFKRCHKIVVLSSEMKEYFIAHKEGNEDKVCVIPNWYNKLSTSKKVKKKNDKLKIFYGGNMGVLQDMETLKQAMIHFKNDPKVEFIFAGHGIKYDEIKKCINEQEIKNATMYEFLPKEQYDRLIDDIDVAVVSLEEDVKGLGSPSKVYSYYAAGKPVIAIVPEDTDIVRDIKEYQNGFTIENGKVKELIKVIKELLCYSMEKMNTLGEFSEQLHNEKYTLKINAEKYLNLLELLN